VYPDYLAAPNISDWTRSQLQYFYDQVPFDGIWLDMNEASNFCSGNCKAPQGDKQKTFCKQWLICVLCLHHDSVLSGLAAHHCVHAVPSDFCMVSQSHLSQTSCLCAPHHPVAGAAAITAAVAAAGLEASTPKDYNLSSLIRTRTACQLECNVEPHTNRLVHPPYNIKNFHW
jgi:alpha-glucosidase (family GH31 glycosyl hydrolase)